MWENSLLSLKTVEGREWHENADQAALRSVGKTAAIGWRRVARTESRLDGNGAA